METALTADHESEDGHDDHGRGQVAANVAPELGDLSGLIDAGVAIDRAKEIGESKHAGRQLRERSVGEGPGVTSNIGVLGGVSEGHDEG